MSEKKIIAELRRENKAMAEILQGIVPQAFTDSKIGETGLIDEGKMAHIKGGMVPFLIYAEHRGKKCNFWKKLHDGILRLSHSVDGRNLKLLAEITGNLGSGARSPRRIVQKPGWIGRNLSKRGWERQAKDRGAEVAE